MKNNKLTLEQKRIAEGFKTAANKQIAIRKFLRGEQYSVSTFIDEESILAGYGKLDLDFEYPLPSVIIKAIFGSLTWEGSKQEIIRKAKVYGMVMPEEDFPKQII